MEILINLLPSFSAYRISYGGVNWAGFLICIPVVVDIRRSIDSHIDKNPKVCTNFRRSNWFPGKLIGGVVELDV